MGVVLANPCMQELNQLQRKLNGAKNEKERKEVFRELEIIQTKRSLAFSRGVNLIFDLNISY